MRVRTTRASGQIGYRMTRRRHDFGYPHRPGNPVRMLAICILATVAAAACIVFPPTAKACTAGAAASKVFDPMQAPAPQRVTVSLR